MGLPICLVIDPLNCFITLDIVGGCKKSPTKKQAVPKGTACKNIL